MITKGPRYHGHPPLRFCPAEVVTTAACAPIPIASLGLRWSRVVRRGSKRRCTGAWRGARNVAVLHQRRRTCTNCVRMPDVIAWPAGTFIALQNDGGGATQDQGLRRSAPRPAI